MTLKQLRINALSFVSYTALLAAMTPMTQEQIMYYYNYGRALENQR